MLLTFARLHYFTNGIVKTWNSLPEETVNAPSVRSLNNGLEKYRQTQDITYDYKTSIDIRSQNMDNRCS
jgi:hypothetical protein